MRWLKKIFILSPAVLWLFFLLNFACSEKPPIHIGFVGGLTGRVADLGTAGRDGALLAVETINESGGINGQLLVLNVKDDKQAPDTASRVVKELIDENVVAIVGHMTSSMSMIGAPIVNRAGVLMLSPTTSTNELSRQDDFFFRLYPAGADAGIKLAEHAYVRRGYSSVAVIYDIGNRAHTEGMYFSYKKKYEQLGGRVFLSLPYLSGPDVDFLNLAGKIKESGAQSVYILTNAMDTAMICQQLAKLDVKLPVITSEWAATENILKFGGATVEGVELVNTFDKTDTSSEYLLFKNKFKNRFGYQPGFASAHAYDAVNMIAAALEKNPDPKQLKQTILDIPSFQGVQGKLYFDIYGDIIRQYHLITISNGVFKRIDL